MLLVLLDVSNNHDCENTLTQLRKVTNEIHTFHDVDRCVNFINKKKLQQIVLILSDPPDSKTVSLVHDLSQVQAIYILPTKKKKKKNHSEEWLKAYSKVKSTYQDVQSLCEALTQLHNEVIPTFVPMHFFAPHSDLIEQHLCYLLKEMLLVISCQEWHRKNFLEHCRQTLTRNSAQLKNIEQFVNAYHAHTPLWWYTSQDSLSTMLDKAFKMKDIGAIVQLGFLIRDLHDQLVQLRREQKKKESDHYTRIVYLGYGLSKDEFQSFSEAKLGLVLFPNFLFTSEDRSSSFESVRRSLSNSNLIGIVFVIALDSAFPFVDTPDGKNVLLSLNSMFQLARIQSIDENDRLYQVELTMIYEKDDRSMPHSTPHPGQAAFADRLDLERLYALLCQLLRVKQGQHILDVLFEKVILETDQANLYRYLALMRKDQKDYSEAFRLYEKALKLFKKHYPRKNAWLKSLYQEFVSIHHCLNEQASSDDKRFNVKEQKHPPSILRHGDLRVNCSKAIGYFKQALDNLEKEIPPNHLILALTYFNTGFMYEHINEYPNALQYYEKSLNVLRNHVSTSNQKLAVVYDKVARMYEKTGDQTKATWYYTKLYEFLEANPILKLCTPAEICRKTDQDSKPISQPTNAPVHEEKVPELENTLPPTEQVEEALEETKPTIEQRLIASYLETGAKFVSTGEYGKAVEPYEKVIQIQERLLPWNHPDLALLYMQLADIYEKIKETSRSFNYYQKAHEIYQQNGTAIDIEVILFYIRFGQLYEKADDFSAALTCYYEVLKWQLAKNPPDNQQLLITYDKIARVYENLAQLSDAVFCYEKVLEILQTTSPVDQTKVVSYYTRMGTILHILGNYHKALSCQEKVLQIRRKHLSSSDPRLALSYNNIAITYYRMGNYPKALSFHKDAIAHNQKILPADHPDLATSYNNVGIVYEKMGKDEEALSICRKAMEMYHKVLPVDHFIVATVYNNLGMLQAKMGEYAEAHSFYERAINIREKLLKTSHLDLASSYTSMGCVLADMERYEEALVSQGKALKILELIVPPNHPYLASTYNNIGVVYKKMGEFTLALSYYEKDLQISEVNLSRNHPDLAVTYNNIGGVYYQMGNWPEAISHHEKALEIRQRALHPKHYDLSQSYHNLGLVYAAMHQTRKAGSFFKRAWDIAQWALPSNHPDLQIYRESAQKTNHKTNSFAR